MPPVDLHAELLRSAFKTAIVDAALRGVLSCRQARRLIVRYRLQAE